VVLGRHHARLASVAERHAPPGATVLGWTDQMPELLKNGHLLIGKAGGATVQEALAAGCPMLVNKVVPGQEEGNAELLCRSGAGAMMPPPAELTDYLLNLVQSKNGASWKTMRQRSISTGRPGAAEAIADLALRLCKS